MSTPTLPSVLLGPPTYFPVPSTSTLPPPPTIRCSQCKQHKLAQDFPKRIVNLQPYQVCLAHDWYWTEEKQAVHWAPENDTGVEELCEDVEKVAKGAEGARDKWKVKGGTEDRAALVQRIALAGKWKSKPKYVLCLSLSRTEHTDDLLHP
jgi:hypothetical protein